MNAYYIILDAMVNLVTMVTWGRGILHNHVKTPPTQMSLAPCVMFKVKFLRTRLGTVRNLLI